MPEQPARAVIVPYDPDWPRVATRPIEAIREACGAVLTDVQHIGSTSVPHLPAKPVIDLMPVVRTFEDGARCIAPLVALGYEHRGEYGIPGRRYFVGLDAASGLVVHAHLLHEGHEQWRGHQVFRDYLRLHPDEATAYAAEKRAVAERVSRADYPEAKAAWVRAAIGRAEEWAATTGWAPQPHRADR